MKKILFIIGSLRAKSFNRQVANEAKEIIGNRAEVLELDYSDLPLLNQDIEQPEPAAVVRIRKAVSEADALWIFTPEYNLSYPGHLKNLLDWMSRPVIPLDYGHPPVLMVSPSPSVERAARQPLPIVVPNSRNCLHSSRPMCCQNKWVLPFPQKHGAQTSLSLQTSKKRN